MAAREGTRGTHSLAYLESSKGTRTQQADSLMRRAARVRSAVRSGSSGWRRRPRCKEAAWRVAEVQAFEASLAKQRAERAIAEGRQVSVEGIPTNP